MWPRVVVKGILFDFEGTVAHRTDGHLEPVLAEVRNLGYDVYRRELQAAHDYVLHVGVPRRGVDHVEAFAEAVLKALDLKPKKTELMALAPLFLEYYRFALFEDAERAVPALAKGHKVGVVSGLPGFFVHPVLALVKPRLAAVVTPKEAKAAVPSPKAFRAAAAALGLRPKEVAVVSADCEDGLAVPKTLGFETVHVGRQGNVVCPHAKIMVTSLDALETMFKPPAPRAAALVTAPQPVGAQVK